MDDLKKQATKLEFQLDVSFKSNHDLERKISLTEYKHRQVLSNSTQFQRLLLTKDILNYLLPIFYRRNWRNAERKF